jgi:hypothetical protein
MPSAYRWVCEKPSRLSILAILLIIIAIRVNVCFATDSQNVTLREVSSYNFSEGYYNVVKEADTDSSNFRILYETDIPYLNITYRAPSDGYLKVMLTPIEGPVPYIQLSKGWETDGLSYSKSILYNDTAYLLLTPPLHFSSSNSSRVVGGLITIWELYNWPDLSGLINYTFTSSEDIYLDINWYPTAPREGDKISFFTYSNAKIFNSTWTISGQGINWVNKTDVLETSDLKAGQYDVSVQGYDEFNNSHTCEKVLTIKPPVLERAISDISLFSIDHPQSAHLGDEVPLLATIDYSVPESTEIKCVLSDPMQGKNITEKRFTLKGNGSTQFSYQFEAKQSGAKSFLLLILYNDNGHWVELDNTRRAFSILITEPDNTQKLPGFNLVSIILGLFIVPFVYRLGSKLK